MDHGLDNSYYVRVKLPDLGNYIYGYKLWQNVLKKIHTEVLGVKEYYICNLFSNDSENTCKSRYSKSFSHKASGKI